MTQPDDNDITPRGTKFTLGFLRWADVALEITIVAGALALLLESCGVLR